MQNLSVRLCYDCYLSANFLCYECILKPTMNKQGIKSKVRKHNNIIIIIYTNSV
jgi:hypothetical protein